MADIETLINRLIAQPHHLRLTEESLKLLEGNLQKITRFYAQVRANVADVVVFWEPGDSIFATTRDDLLGLIPEDSWARKVLNSPGGEGILGGFHLAYVQEHGERNGAVTLTKEIPGGTA